MEGLSAELEKNLTLIFTADVAKRLKITVGNTMFLTTYQDVVNKAIGSKDVGRLILPFGGIILKAKHLEFSLRVKQKYM